MGDAGSERSKAPSLPPRCPCGFWGSSKTMNLCSKCFAEKRNPHNEKDFQKKQPDDDSTPGTSNSQSDLFSGETNSDNSNTSLTTQAANSNQQLLTELNVTSPSKEECGPCTGTAHASLTTPTKRSCDSDSQSESEASPVKRPRLLDDSNDRPEETSRSKQKSRRRCFQCQTKLELVQQELGSCRCGEYCLSVVSSFQLQPCSDLCHAWKYTEHLCFSPCKDALNRSFSFHWQQKVIISS
ncbi:PREDICTED: AN1-type zinc finger protein 3 [Sturnus vulgaris]|uniref:AN1-type zinc finger protein 3 n=1 Tax=Sturnus vulgaris TaxID=9172 RepID=UPI00071A12B8|nr:PREDICTED: AN1-type zinc finger protein 3 [Sturnus vulgaris]